MNNIINSIINENNKLILENKELKKQISVLSIDSIQYKNLRECFSKVVTEILGEDYYNMGMDVYTCDRLSAEDIIKALKKRRKRYEK